MRYISTRGDAPELNFEDALLCGLARDGGLYVPKKISVFARSEIAALAGARYPVVAATIAERFVGDVFTRDELRQLCHEAYENRFGHPSMAPLVQLSDQLFLLELFRGPTLAFKDFAMLLVGRMFEAVLSRRKQRATIVGATSGDTGSAAIEAFKGLDSVDVFILYPHNRVSDVQRRQMTTPPDSNIHALAIEGDFDACQALVKAMFNDHNFRDKMRLAAVNSINWARVMAQIVYYFTSAVSLGAPSRHITFSVPTGNFGDIYAGLMAKRMGLPIDRLIIATNENDILHRAMSTGRYAVSDVTPTTSPSMDIQVSSNFERALFEASGNDSDAIKLAMANLAQSGSFKINAAALAALRQDFDSARVSLSEVSEQISQTYQNCGYILDPHSAIGVHAAGQIAPRSNAETPIVSFACAHPAKFPDAVGAAAGVSPAFPAHLADLFDRPERMTILPNDLAAIQAHISAKSHSA